MTINLENKYNILLPKILYKDIVLFEGNRNNDEDLFVIDEENAYYPSKYELEGVFNVFEIYPEKEFAPERGIVYLVTITYNCMKHTLNFSILPNLEFQPDEIIKYIKNPLSREEIHLTEVYGNDIVNYVRKIYHGGFLMKNLNPYPFKDIEDVSLAINYHQNIASNEYPDTLPPITCDAIFNEPSGGIKKSYVQSTNGNIYIRSFLCYNVPDELICYEYSRIHVDKDFEITFFSRKLNGNWEDDTNYVTPSDMCLNIVGHDDISNTYLKYFELDEYLLYRIKYPAIDNALKMGLTNLISYVTRFSSGIVNNVLCRTFGTIDVNAKSFSKMIGVPNHILPFLNDNKKYIKSVKYLKLILSTETFKSLEHESMKKIIKSTYNLISSVEENNQLIIGDILKFLIEKKGIKNILDYIDYIYNNIRISSYYYSMYRDYLTMCDYLGTHYEWKIDNVFEEHERVNELYNLITDKEIKEKFSKNFDEAKPYWDKYLYDNDPELIVIAPSSIDDIIDEGLSLHHCVKSYINAICSKTTNILFIRKKEDIKTPFYTIEIREGNIRQCHGLCNSDMTDEIKKFVAEYAANKKLSVNWNNGALHV